MHVVSTAADAGIAVALAGTLFFNLPTDAARTRVGAYLLLTLAPFALVAPLLAPAVDRLARHPMRAIAATGWLRAGLALAIAFFPTAFVLYPASFFVLVLGRAYAITKRATVPSVVEPGTPLLGANAQLSRGGTTAAAAGGLLATALMPLGGALLALQAAAALHAGSALLARRITTAPLGVAPAPAPTERADVGTEVRTVSLVAPVAAMAALRVTTGLLAFTIAFSLRRVDASAIAFGIVAMSVPVGSFAGTFLSPRLRDAHGDERFILGGCLAVAALVVAAAAPGGMIGLALALPVVALASSIGRHAYDSILQHSAAPRERNRVFARCEAVLQIAWVAGALIPTLITISAPAVQMLTAGLLALLALPISVRVTAAHRAELRAAVPVPARVAA